MSTLRPRLMDCTIHEWQPLARRHWHSARQITATLLRTNRMLASPRTIRSYRCHWAPSTSADPTTRLHANSKGRHEPERPQAPPASGRPLKERPTGTSVTRQANTPNSKDHLNYRNSSEALSPGLSGLAVGRSSESNARRDQAGDRRILQQRH